jgi:hypothetical protein
LIDRSNNGDVWESQCVVDCGVVVYIVFCGCFSTLPNVETPYPMLVLVGPEGSGKKELALQLVYEFADYFGFGLVVSCLQFEFVATYVLCLCYL